MATLRHSWSPNVAARPSVLNPGGPPGLLLAAIGLAKVGLRPAVAVLRAQGRCCRAAVPSARLSRRVSELLVLHKDYMTVRWADVFSGVGVRKGHLRDRASLVGDVSRRAVGRINPDGTVVESMSDRWDRV
jgi:hypothetical protein